jgi:hypothetical protein
MQPHPTGTLYFGMVQELLAMYNEVCVVLQ